MRWNTFALMAAAGVLACMGCQTAEPRLPNVDMQTVPDYATRRVRDIAVLPVGGVEVTDPGGLVLPSSEIRHFMYQYLIRNRNYATPKLSWVDERLAAGEASARALNTDAILTLEIEQWDASQLGGSGVVYAGGSFKLEDAAGRELWHYRSRDQRITVPAPYGGDNTLANLRWGARSLVEAALDTLPPAPRLAPSEP
jgi:hypothetical protein